MHLSSRRCILSFSAPLRESINAVELCFSMQLTLTLTPSVWSSSTQGCDVCVSVFCYPEGSFTSPPFRYRTSFASPWYLSVDVPSGCPWVGFRWYCRPQSTPERRPWRWFASAVLCVGRHRPAAPRLCIFGLGATGSPEVVDRAQVTVSSSTVTAHASSAVLPEWTLHDQQTSERAIQSVEALYLHRYRPTVRSLMPIRCPVFEGWTCSEGPRRVLPGWAWALVSPHSNIPLWLLHSVAQLARCLTGVTTKDRCDGTPLWYEMCVMCVSLLSRLLPYRMDTWAAFRSPRVEYPGDSYLPASVTLGGDCEDLTYLSLRTFLSWVALPTTDGLLKDPWVVAVRDTLCTFTPLMTHVATSGPVPTGEQTPSLSNHMMLLLLPKSSPSASGVQRREVCVESTGWVEGDPFRSSVCTEAASLHRHIDRLLPLGTAEARYPPVLSCYPDPTSRTVPFYQYVVGGWVGQWASSPTLSGCEWVALSPRGTWGCPWTHLDRLQWVSSPLHTREDPFLERCLSALTLEEPPAPWQPPMAAPENEHTTPLDTLPMRTQNEVVLVFPWDKELSARSVTEQLSGAFTVRSFYSVSLADLEGERVGAHLVYVSHR